VYSKRFGVEEAAAWGERGFRKNAGATAASRLHAIHFLQVVGKGDGEVRSKHLPYLILLLSAASAYAQLPPTPKSSDLSKTIGPKIVTPKALQELGAVIEGDRISVKWTLRNEGDADLVISDTKASCGCTVVALPEEQKVIPPGKEIELVAEFNSQGRRGSQRKSVNVESNDTAEPSLKLEFSAEVVALFTSTPPGALNLRMLRRGESAEKRVELLPGGGRNSLTVEGIELSQEEFISATVEESKEGGGAGKAVRFTVSENAPLGIIDATAVIHLNVDGIRRDTEIRIRGEVVADLVCQPRMVDMTRIELLQGKSLTPVVIRSSESALFDIIRASAGETLDVACHPEPNAKPRTEYSCIMTVRANAPSGPFGAMLQVETSSLDQPVVSVPVFGIVAPRVEVDPPVVVLRQDGTPIGSHRRVRLQARPGTALVATSADCTLGSIKVARDEQASNTPHVRFLDVSLGEKLTPGIHEAKLTVQTNVEGAEPLEIPIRVEVPG